MLEVKNTCLEWEKPQTKRILFVLRNDVDHIKAVNCAINVLSLILNPEVYILYIANIEPIPFHEKTEKEFYTKLREEGKKIVKKTIEKFRNAGIRAKLYDMYFGIAAEKIVKAERELQPDLIILCARGLSMFKKILVGSVSDTVLAEAKKPVVIVKPNSTK